MKLNLLDPHRTWFLWSINDYYKVLEYEFETEREHSTVSTFHIVTVSAAKMEYASPLDFRVYYNINRWYESQSRILSYKYVWRIELFNFYLDFFGCSIFSRAAQSSLERVYMYPFFEFNKCSIFILWFWTLATQHSAWKLLISIRMFFGLCTFQM